MVDQRPGRLRRDRRGGAGQLLGEAEPPPPEEPEPADRRTVAVARPGASQELRRRRRRAGGGGPAPVRRGAGAPWPPATWARTRNGSTSSRAVLQRLARAAPAPRKSLAEPLPRLGVDVLVLGVRGARACTGLAPGPRRGRATRPDRPRQRRNGGRGGDRSLTSTSPIRPRSPAMPRESATTSSSSVRRCPLAAGVADALADGAHPGLRPDAARRRGWSRARRSRSDRWSAPACRPRASPTFTDADAAIAHMRRAAIGRRS